DDIRMQRFQVVVIDFASGNLEHETARPFRASTDTRLGEISDATRIGSAGPPMDPIGKGVFALGLKPIMGVPVSNNVIVNLLLRRDFEQIHGPGTPVTDRLDPLTRAPLEM